MAKVKVNRSAITGQFVKESYVKTHKKTTVTEHIRKGDPKKK